MHVYIHVPFCSRRCSYCDFAIAVRRDIPSREYADAVLREWAGWQFHPVWDLSSEIETIYLGGGTPSRLDVSEIARLLDRIAMDRPVADGAEITLEANPDDITAPLARAWQVAGVNRISLGVQSFNPGVLEWMHRTHTADQARLAVETLRTAGVGDLSLDLIFGLPAALGRDWKRDLEHAFALEPDHLSLYGLTIEHHTPLGHWTARGEVQPVEDECYAAEFLNAAEQLLEHGFDHYELSNAARPGHRSRHNSGYWRRASYIGLGPSAHSGWGAVRQWNLREWSQYLQASETGAAFLAGQEQLSAHQIELEEIYLGLRTLEGVARERVPREVRDRWVPLGWATENNGRLRLSAEGWLRLDALVGEVAQWTGEPLRA